MVLRLKYRVYEEASTRKFSFNVQEGVTLFLDHRFHPVANGQGAFYSLRLSPLKTELTFLQTALWNGKPAPQGSTPTTLRIGHLLTAREVSIEILDCPEPAEKSTEQTQFLDLHGLKEGKALQTAAPAASRLPVDPEPRIGEARRSVVPLTASADVQFERTKETETAENSDAPDKVVVPLASLEESKTGDTSPLVTEKRDRDEPLQSRKTLFLKAAAMATVVGASIFGAYWWASHYHIEMEEGFRVTSTESTVTPIPDPVFVQVPVHPVAESTEPEAPSRGLASVGSEEALAPPPADNPANPLPALPAAEAKPEGMPEALARKELLLAIEEGNLAKVKQLVESEGLSPDFTLDELGRTPFLRAAASGRLTVMKYLLAQKVSPDGVDYNGNTALMWATINGHEKTARFLLELGLKVDAKREDGKNALSLARQYRQKEVEKLLRDRRKEDARRPASLPPGQN